MKYVDSLAEVNLPQKHTDFLRVFIDRVSQIDSVERVILFGSCAKECTHQKSDIDIMVIGDHITNEEESLIYFDCIPDWSSGYYVENDVLTCTNNLYDEYKSVPGYVQRAIEKHGVDLTEYLSKVRRGVMNLYENAEYWEGSAKDNMTIKRYRTSVYSSCLAIELFLKSALNVIDPNSDYLESHDVVNLYNTVARKYPPSSDLTPVVKKCRKHFNESRYPVVEEIYDEKFADEFIGYVLKIRNYVDNECHINDQDLLTKFKSHR